MGYFSEVIEYNRPVKRLDIALFAADLTKALDKLLPSVDVVKLIADKPDDIDRNNRRSIQVGNDRIDLSANGYKGKVHVYITAPDVPHGDWSTYDKEQRTVDATVSPDARSIEAIAKDINKRVIEANAPALAKRRAHAAQQKANRDGIAKHCADLKAAIPGLDIRLKDGEQRATFYGNGGFDGYLSGTINTDGSISLERLSVSNSQFRKIAKLLSKEGK